MTGWPDLGASQVVGGDGQGGRGDSQGALCIADGVIGIDGAAGGDGVGLPDMAAAVAVVVSVGVVRLAGGVAVDEARCSSP